MAQRNLYLSNTPIDEARKKYIASFDFDSLVKYETIQVTDSLGRITRHAVYAKYSSPLYNASAMDGIACVSKSTDKARETAPVTLKRGKDFVVVDTGDPIRHPFDCVIMAEDITETEDGDAGDLCVGFALAECAPCRRGYSGWRNDTAVES